MEEVALVGIELGDWIEEQTLVFDACDLIGGETGGDFGREWQSKGAPLSFGDGELEGFGKGFAFDGEGADATRERNGHLVPLGAADLTVGGEELVRAGSGDEARREGDVLDHLVAVVVFDLDGGGVLTAEERLSAFGIDRHHPHLDVAGQHGEFEHVGTEGELLWHTGVNRGRLDLLRLCVEELVVVVADDVELVVVGIGSDVEDHCLVGVVLVGGVPIEGVGAVDGDII